jgi:flavin-binding protein dodecin
VTRSTTARAVRLDQVCASAVDVAREGITEVDPADVGDHQGAIAEGDRLVTHLFECKMAGYQGWQWAVTVTRVPRSRHVTICETFLLPGPDALLAPAGRPRGR